MNGYKAKRQYELKQITFTWTEWWIRISRRGITRITHYCHLVWLHSLWYVTQKQ
jgi:hypothetical protein